MCGVFGIRAPERDVSRVTFFGLFALQHRGQESAGIAVSDRGRLTVLRDELLADGIPLSTTSDTEVIAALIANDTAPLEEAVAKAMRRLEGAFTIVALAEGKL